MGLNVRSREETIIKIKKALISLLRAAEKVYDSTKLRIRRAVGFGALEILPYRGYVTETQLFLRGRVMENYGVRPPRKTHSIWRNLINTFHRFRTHEIPGVKVRARFRDHEESFTTDVEGFFSVLMQLDPPFEAPPRWHEVALWLPDLDQSGEATITGRVIGPFPGAAFGVISDIDETVIQTGIDDLIKLAHNTFVVNAYKRLPFPGVREFYMALRRGISGEGFNPIFYVSNAPWNLYDLIQDVFRIRDIPLGPFFLVGWGLEDTHLFRASPFEHKLGSIDQIMDAYPHLDFILLGDNTEKDPEIYLEAVRRHPHRIKVVYVYLRGQPSSQSESHLEQIGARVREAGSDFVSVRSVVEAASDAASRGLIQPSTIESVKQAYEKES